MTCPRCGSIDTRRATVYWQCLTCEQEWLEPLAEQDENVQVTPTDTRAGWEPRRSGYTHDQYQQDKAKRDNQTQEEGPMTSTTQKYERPSELLADMHSHGITNAEILSECSFDTSAIPTFTADETVQKIQDRGLGGELDIEAHSQQLIYGWTTASALARQFLSEDPGAAYMGRGSSFRACVSALEKAGH
jgi:hypothetical protein